MYYVLPSTSEFISHHRPNGLSSSRVLNLNSSQIFTFRFFTIRYAFRFFIMLVNIAFLLAFLCAKSKQACEHVLPTTV